MASTLLVPRNTLPATMFDFCTLALTVGAEDELFLWFVDLSSWESVYDTLEMPRDDDALWTADACPHSEDRPFFHRIEMR